MIRILRTTVLAAVCVTAVSAGAQEQATYNDTVRTRSWSVYVGGGVNGTSNVRGMEAATRRYAGPEAWLGAKYYINPMWRVGVNAGYARNKFVNGNLLNESSENPNFMIGDRPATLYTDGVRVNGTQRSDICYGDLNIDWNIMDLWHNRKNQRFNIWLGVGAGFMHANWKGSEIWAMNEHAIAQSESWFNVYDHSYVISRNNHNIANTLYLPATLSIEWDLSPSFTVGLRGQFKYMPLNHNAAPYGMWSAGATIAYNFNGRKIPKTRVVEVIKEVPVEVIKTQINEVVKEVPVEKTDFLSTETAIFFKINEWEISDESMVRLSLVAKAMKANPDMKFVIEGYADSATGTPQRNMTLSERRAEAVYNALVGYGVNPDQLRMNANGGRENMFGQNKLNRVSIIQVAQ